MKTTKFLLLAFALCRILTSSYAFAQEEEMIFPEQDSSVNSPSSSNPPVIIDESDSSGVSDVEEYDG